MAKPQIKQDKILKLLEKHGVDLEKEKFMVFGIRGYFLNSGRAGVNDRGIYDDALGMIDIDGNFQIFQANTDPSSTRKGKGTGGAKGMARVKPGFYKDLWRIGPHKKIKVALRQANKITVIRDGVNGDYEDTGTSFMINGHPGGSVRTSSAGCQTFIPSDWPSAISMAVARMKAYDKKFVSYLLMENDGSIA